MSAVNQTTIDNFQPSNISLSSDRLYRLKEMMEVLKISKTGIYDKMDPRSKRYDPEFPLPIKLGPNAVAWRKSEVQYWIRSRPRKAT